MKPGINIAAELRFSLFVLKGLNRGRKISSTALNLTLNLGFERFHTVRTMHGAVYGCELGTVRNLPAPDARDSPVPWKRTRNGAKRTFLLANDNEESGVTRPEYRYGPGAKPASLMVDRPVHHLPLLMEALVSLFNNASRCFGAKGERISA